ncbi:MAG: exodeoxyribonuclease VII large subunit [Chloroflexota bacterium]|jgi:exodeoxyribonuclease VII large subunit
MLFGEQELEGPTWTVGELTAYIRELFDIDYRLRSVRVEGEISNFTRARSGHLYFTIKDAQAQLKCVMWRSAAERLSFSPDDGDSIIASGRVSVYEAGGVYQLYADSLEPAGRGALALAFERLKRDLAAEGLFAPEHKKSIPVLPVKIGIVTSIDAAALRDVLNVLGRRWPLLQVLVAPTLVQGQDAPRQIVQALQWLDGRHDIDTIILTRGGGSIEDLWPFNDEHVARAIYAADHPIIVGVGHETDFTISDFVADLRAPTPSAAAELAVPDSAEVRAAIAEMAQAAASAMRSSLAWRSNTVVGLMRALGHLSPIKQLESGRQRTDWLAGRLDKAMFQYLVGLKSRLMVSRAAMEGLGPMATLRRGYAIVRNEDGVLVRSAGQVEEGDRLKVQVADGEFEAKVD